MLILFINKDESPTNNSNFKYITFYYQTKQKSEHAVNKQHSTSIHSRVYKIDPNQITSELIGISQKITNIHVFSSNNLLIANANTYKIKQNNIPNKSTNTKNFQISCVVQDTIILSKQFKK